MHNSSRVLPDATIHQAKANLDKYVELFYHPAAHFGTVTEGGMYELKYTAQDTFTH